MTTIRCKVSFRSARQRKAAAPPDPPPPKPEGPTPLARRLALAHLLERLIDEGRLHDYAHAARVLGVSRPRLTQLADLALLPVEVQERILAGNVASEREARRAAPAVPPRRPSATPSSGSTEPCA